MRIISGQYRGRRLQSLPGETTRPMLDRMRQTLFDILRDRMQGHVFADLYAGTGAVGIEALSQGAARAIFVESNPQAVRVIHENLARVGAAKDALVLASTVTFTLPQIEADIYFLGPPYFAVAEYQESLALLGGRRAPLVVAQHPKALVLAETYGSLQRRRVVTQGNNCLSFYEPAEEAPGASQSGS